MMSGMLSAGPQQAGKGAPKRAPAGTGNAGAVLAARRKPDQARFRSRDPKPGRQCAQLQQQPVLSPADLRASL